MSGSDDRIGTSEGQEESGKNRGNEPPQDIHLREMRMAFGAIYREDIEAAYGISDKTVLEWILRGLKDFRPGTKKTCFLRSDVEEFLKRRETFQGREQKRRLSNAKKKGATKGRKETP